MHVRQVSKTKTKQKQNPPKNKKQKNKKQKKKLKKVKYMGFCLFYCYAWYTYSNEYQAINFTASLLVHLFFGCLKHLNTNKMSVAKIMKANSR